MKKSILIGCGLFSAIGLGLYFYSFFTNELYKTNKKGREIGKIAKFEKAMKELKGFKNKELRDQWLKICDDQSKLYKNETEQIKTYLRSKNNYLNNFFEDLSLDSDNLPDPNDFKSTYINEIENLSDDYIRKANASSDKDTYKISTSLPHFLSQWGEDRPPQPSLQPAMRQYNILLSLYDSLKQSRIYHIEKIEFPETLRPSKNKKTRREFYSQIPVKIICELEMNQVTILLNNLLKNKNLIFQIDEFAAEKSKGNKLSQAKPLKNGLKITLKLNVLEFQNSIIKRNKET